MLRMVNDYRNYATRGTTGFLVQNLPGKKGSFFMYFRPTVIYIVFNSTVEIR